MTERQAYPGLYCMLREDRGIRHYSLEYVALTLSVMLTRTRSYYAMVPKSLTMAVQMNATAASNFQR